MSKPPMPTEKEKPMTDVFAYLRVSGKSQVTGDGFRRQFIAIRKYCEANQLRIVRIFREKGITGTTELENRPALSDLFGELEATQVRSIVIEKLDRLARDLMVQESIVADMQRHEYNLLSSCEPDLCSKDPSRVLIRQIFGAFSQYEKAMIVLKLRGARQRKKARGERGEGRHAFGEKPGEDVVLLKMHSLRSAGATLQEIADKLAADNDPSRMGKGWNSGTVHKILTRSKMSANCA
jgi:DNA invertase Pin-like site-specific DNA recombinase